MKPLLSTLATAVTVLLFMVGCSQELELPPISKSKTDFRTSKIEISEALENASTLMTEFEGNTKSVDREIESIQIVGNDRTRSETSDTLLYLVNYKGNEGFALLGSDQRMSSVLLTLIQVWV